MSAIADELSHRANPHEVKRKTKERVVKKSHEAKERFLDSPGAFSVVGGLLGAGIASAVGKMISKRRHPEPPPLSPYAYRPTEIESPASMGRTVGYGPMVPDTRLDEPVYVGADVAVGPSVAVGYSDERWDDDGGGVKEKAHGLKERVSAKASELQHKAQDKGHELSDRVSAKASELQHKAQDKKHELSDRAEHARASAGSKISEARERTPNKGQLKAKISSRYHQAIDDQPMALGVATIGLGMVLGGLAPVTAKEREKLGPLKEKAERKLDEVADKYEHRAEEKLGEGVSQEHGVAAASSEALAGSFEPEPSTEWSSDTDVEIDAPLYPSDPHTSIH